MITHPDTPETELPDTAHPPETPEDVMAVAASRIAELESERDEFRDKWLRAEAETQNVRTRAKRDVDETRQ